MGVFKPSRSYRLSRARYFMRYATLLALTLLSANDAASQWTKLTRAGPGNYIIQTGALAFRDGKLWFGRDKLYLSTDTGKTWTAQPGIPSIDTSSRNSIYTSDIDFLDGNHGIVCGGAGIFLTSDGGQNWLQNPGIGYSAVLLDSENASLFSSGENVMRAAPNSTWQVASNSLLCVRTNHDRNRCYYIEDTSFGSGFAFETVDNMLYSDDLGETWHKPGGQFAFDCFTMAVDSCNDSLVFMANENYYGAPLAKDCYVLKSTNMGTSWSTVFTAPKRSLTGGIVTSTQGIYCQSMTEGLIRSTDKGKTWTVIGGPSSVADSRTLTVVNDTTIIAGDSLGNVWEFFDPEAIANVQIPAPVISPDTIHIELCDSSKFTIAAVPAGCHAYILDTVYATSADTGKVLISVSNFTPNDSNFTTQASFIPLEIGTFTAQVHTRQGFGGLVYDRSAPVTFVVSPGPAHYEISNTALAFGNVALCSSASSQITIFNDGCDTLRFLKYQPNGDLSAFGLDTILPQNLPIGDSEVLHFTCSPDSLRNYLASLSITTNGGVSNIAFSAIGVPDSPRVTLMPPSIAFQNTIAKCGVDTSSVAFTNSSCAFVRVDSMSSQPSGIFSPVALAIPATLSKDSSVILPFSFSPADSGISNGNATIYYSDANGREHDTIIALSGTGLPDAAFSAEVAQPIPISAGILDTVAIPLDIALSNKLDAPQSGALPMEFKIVCNTNLLSPFKIEISNSSISLVNWGVNADTITIDISIDMAKFLAASQDDTLVEALRVMAMPYVSDSLATDIALTSLSSAWFMTDCLDYSLASSASRFTVVLTCSDSILSKFMSTQRLLITSLNPNPATKSIEVGYSLDTTLLDQNVRWYIFDAKGTLSSDGIALSSPVTLAVSKLNSGEYFLYLNRGVQQDREEVSRAFVIER